MTDHEFVPPPPPANPLGFNDQGSLRITLDINRTARKITLEFGKPITAIGMTELETETMIRALSDKLKMLRMLV